MGMRKEGKPRVRRREEKSDRRRKEGRAGWSRTEYLK
jgi:hypothetical protein